MPHLTRDPPVTLHLGAHRTATSSLQHLLERDAAPLARAGVAVWTPRRTRAGLLTGVLGDPGRQAASRDRAAHRAAGRVAMLRSEMAALGLTRLVLSEENALGGLRENLLMARLYPSAAPRLERLARAVPGIDRVCLAIRSPAAWWTSAFAFLMTRGFAPPDRATLEAIASARRGWRQVIEDVARVFPGAEVAVWEFEGIGQKPVEAFAALTGRPPRPGPVRPLNAALPLGALRARLRAEGCMTPLPERGGRYAPFPPDLGAALDARHAAEVTWLRDGADGLATYIDGAHEDARTGQREEATHDRRQRRYPAWAPRPLDEPGCGRVEGPRA
ncbi:hypothetical protein [Jannaschia ovalis]|uniref:Sulfotransferase family protein n=1 Tax=Jannaschia ovalis TaxID=3038773 RepID=A0ABY8LBQ3_9RHOB|nr:hypothetical protein [Jannaschia sp. GRR-S6-38]WGH78047.1 hypothetical protein P8627_13550 [Jannaschia sp. GRR-S6-38]